MDATDMLTGIIRAPSCLPDEALTALSDSDLCSLLCRLEQWQVAAKSEWDWRRHWRATQTERRTA